MITALLNKFGDWSEWGNEDLTRDYFSFYDIFCIAAFLLPFIIIGISAFLVIRSVYL